MVRNLTPVFFPAAAKRQRGPSPFFFFNSFGPLPPSPRVLGDQRWAFSFPLPLRLRAQSPPFFFRRGTRARFSPLSSLFGWMENASFFFFVDAQHFFLRRRGQTVATWDLLFAGWLDPSFTFPPLSFWRGGEHELASFLSFYCGVLFPLSPPSICSAHRRARGTFSFFSLFSPLFPDTSGKMNLSFFPSVRIS